MPFPVIAGRALSLCKSCGALVASRFTDIATQHKLFSCAGFTQHFARQGMWGLGNYYSCHPALAVSYKHRPHPSAESFCSHLADIKHVPGTHAPLYVAYMQVSQHRFSLHLVPVRRCYVKLSLCCSGGKLYFACDCTCVLPSLWMD